MSGKEVILAALKELILPELSMLRQEQAEIKASLVLTNKRLDDVNTHLVDQSRRIDALREEVGGRIDAFREELGGRIDALREELGGRIDALRKDLSGRLDTLSGRLDDTNKRLDSLHTDLVARNDETNRSISRLYEVIVRRDEHQQLSSRIERMEREMEELKKRIAA